jgi:ferric-dicitrate binding protein FerR (iron transport regulator)
MTDHNLLISAYVDEDLTADEAAELTGWLRRSTENVDEFVCQCQLHCALQGLMSVSEIRRQAELLRSSTNEDLPREPAAVKTLYGVRLELPEDEPSEDAAPNPPRVGSYAVSAAHSAPSRVQWRRWAAAAAVLIGLAIISALLRSSGQHSFDASPVLLSRTIDAHWTGGAPVAGIPLTLHSELSLSAGYAELTFGGGATVIVEGPCRFSVESGEKLFLSAGKLSAAIPHAVRAFTVATPGASIVDLGTEFGVCACENGNTDVQVFNGSVQLSATSSSTAATESVKLTQGDARRVSANATIASIGLNDSTFVRPKQFDQWAKAGDAGPLARWKAFSERFRRDPDLIAYYTFDKNDQTPEKLVNQSSVGESLDGLLGGQEGEAPQPTWGDGRWPGKGALFFSSLTPQYVQVPSSPALDFSRGPPTARPFTIWAWVRGGGLNDAGIVTRGDGLAEQYSLGAQSGSYRAWVREKPVHLSPWSGTSSPFGLHENARSATDGEWHFVASVYDPTQKKLNLFVDARPPQSVQAPTKLLDTLDPLRIGSQQITHFTAPFGFQGCIDEVAIVGRAMSAGQLRAIYNAGKQ